MFVIIIKNLLRNVIVSIIEEDYPGIVYSDDLYALKVKKLFDDSKLPSKGSKDAAGLDLHAHSCALIKDGTIEESVNLDTGHVLIPPMSRCLIKTGLAFSIPEGCYGLVAPRSGLALKKGIQIGGGVIDRDYTGEVGVIIFNNNSEHFEVKKDDAIAQLICQCIVYPQTIEVKNLIKTDRGSDGFGSTG